MWTAEYLTTAQSQKCFIPNEMKRWFLPQHELTGLSHCRIWEISPPKCNFINVWLVGEPDLTMILNQWSRGHLRTPTACMRVLMHQKQNESPHTKKDNTVQSSSSISFGRRAGFSAPLCLNRSQPLDVSIKYVISSKWDTICFTVFSVTCASAPLALMWARVDADGVLRAQTVNALQLKVGWRRGGVTIISGCRWFIHKQNKAEKICCCSQSCF